MLQLRDVYTPQGLMEYSRGGINKLQAELLDFPIEFQNPFLGAVAALTSQATEIKRTASISMRMPTRSSYWHFQ